MKLLDLDDIFDNNRIREPLARHVTPDIGPDDLPGDWRVLWEERAAILEYEGGLLRERAEHEALLDIVKQMNTAS